MHFTAPAKRLEIVLVLDQDFRFFDQILHLLVCGSAHGRWGKHVADNASLKQRTEQLGF